MQPVEAASVIFLLINVNDAYGFRRFQRLIVGELDHIIQCGQSSGMTHGYSHALPRKFSCFLAVCLFFTVFCLAPIYQS